MGFFADLIGNADPLILGGLFGVGGGGNKAAGIIGNPLGTVMGSSGSNPMSGITGMMGGGGAGGMGGLFGGAGDGSGSGFDVGAIGSFGGGGGGGGGGSSGMPRTGATGNPTYPTSYGNANSAYPLAFMGELTGSEAVYGRKPDYPLAPTPDEILRANIYANTANQPGAQNFAAGTNRFNLDQLTGQFNETTPGLYDARTRQLSNIRSGLEGELSQPTLDALKRSGAAWGLTSGTGTPSAGNQAGNRTLRDLGRSVEDRQALAGRELESLIASTRRDLLPPLSDPTQSTLQPSYDPYAEDQRLVDIAKVLAAPVPSAAGAAAAQQALIEGLLAFYSGTAKSGSTDPSNYYVDWDGGYSGMGAGSGEPGYGGGGRSSYIPYNTGGNSNRGIGFGIGSLFGG